MSARSAAPIHLYVTAIAGAGLLVVVHLAFPGLGSFHATPAFWMFAALTVVGELWPLRVRRRDVGGVVTTSSTFCFAILLSFGAPAAVIMQGLASLVADLGARKGLNRTAFNFGQYVLSFAAGGAVLQLLTGTSRLVADGGVAFHHVPALIVAAVVIFLTQTVLTSGAVALSTSEPVWGSLRRDFAFNLSTAGVLLTLSPILAVVADRSPSLIPLLMLTVMAVYKSAQVSQEKEHLALHDLLTDLPNRRLFMERVSRALYAAKRSGEPVALLVVDLDRFKEVNDSLGHHVGDQVLQQIGPRLRASVREIDTIARLGGDEFAVLLHDIDSVEHALAVARRIVLSLDRPITVQGFPLDIDASVGVAVYPTHGEDVDSLLEHADVAMYIAKKDQVGAAVYSSDRDRQGRGRLALLGQLRRALEDRQLTLHYQPKAEMRTGRIRGVEALVRWQHPDLGLISPEDFIPLAEHTELIGPLTRHVMSEALRQVSAWHREGLMISVAVNLSVQNLYDVQFPVDVGRLLGHWGIDPSWLELEITENTVMADPLRARGVIEELAGMGVRIAVDDFGTGYSSLTHLRQLPVSDVKIDKSFVMQLDRNENDAVIVRSIIDLARNLGLHVVAEGVESAEVWEQLAEMGCHAAQGYHLCRPVTAVALSRWLHDTCKRSDIAGPMGMPPLELISDAVVPRGHAHARVASLEGRHIRRVG